MPEITAQRRERARARERAAKGEREGARNRRGSDKKGRVSIDSFNVRVEGICIFHLQFKQANFSSVGIVLLECALPLRLSLAPHRKRKKGESARVKREKFPATAPIPATVCVRACLQS